MLNLIGMCNESRSSVLNAASCSSSSSFSFRYYQLVIGSHILTRQSITTNWGMYDDPVGPDVPGHLTASASAASQSPDSIDTS